MKPPCSNCPLRSAISPGALPPGRSRASRAPPAGRYNGRMDISDEDLRVCVRVLRAIEANRSHLTRLTQEQRRELLTLAGLVAKPERHNLVRMAKAFRRAE